MKNKKAAELRSQYESRVREATRKKNDRINQAKSDFEAEVKAIRREIYNL
jgi:F0F1-type ATP synthase membrane subunit b/b'